MKSKIIKNPSIARQLLHKGNQILDIKPNKENPRETVFVFNESVKFKNDLTEISNK